MNRKKVEDEINFKELLSNPLRLFAIVYPYFFIVIILIGIFYVKNLDSISYNTIPVSYIDSLNVERDIPLKKGGIMPAVDLSKIKSPDQTIIDKGKELYDANCLSCHGAQGMGDGPAGVALNPKPRNFQEETGWTNGRNFQDLYKTLQEGIIKNGMAAYEYLSPADRISIIHYMRTLAEYPEITEEQISEVDLAYRLSEGTNVPNQIPVKKSESLIIKEFKNSESQAGLFNYLEKTSELPGARLLKEYSFDPAAVAQSTFYGEIESTTDDFIKSVSLAPNERGFNSSIIALDKSNWQNLFTYLRQIANLNKQIDAK